MARSNALLLPRLGARVVLCGPPALLPEVALELGPGITIERDFDQALAQAQIVMMLRIQKERLTGLHIDLNEYMTRYQLDQERLHTRAPQAIVMHPGPMIRGLEITSEVADGPQSVIAEAGKKRRAHSHGVDSSGAECLSCHNLPLRAAPGRSRVPRKPPGLLKQETPKKRGGS